MVDNKKNFLEKILYSLPLFKGYLTREERRESDRILREYIVKNLENLKEKILSESNSLVKRFGLQIMNTTGEVISEIDALKNKIEFAPHGYSAFFDTVKIGEEELNYIYSLDKNILENVETLNKKVDPIKTLGGERDIEILMSNILIDVKNIVKDFDRRNEFLKGIR